MRINGRLIFTIRQTAPGEEKIERTADMENGWQKHPGKIGDLTDRAVQWDAFAQMRLKRLRMYQLSWALTASAVIHVLRAGQGPLFR
jgi:hypothetical protein